MDPSGIKAMLLGADFERAKKESKRQAVERVGRTVEVCHTTAAGIAAAAAIKTARYAACDIECYDSEILQCIGFAASPNQAYVFVGEAVPLAFALLRDAGVRKVFQNGQFDAYFLKTRCGIEVAGWTDDCMIAWHALWPEIAGKGKKGSKRTRKSLAFLASIYTESPEWWKEYGGDDASMYELNGLDCCITFEIMQNLAKEIVEQDVAAIYTHEMSMMPVLLAIQERGLLIDDAFRLSAIQQLATRAASIETSIRSLAEPLLRQRSDAITKPHLFFGTAQCPCCNGGKVKAMACWSCAGLEGPPGKRSGTVLGPCKACGGIGKHETFEFNPASPQQQAELFYNVLGLPKRFNDGKLACDEKALKGLLAECQE